jgi:hypothetical protein
VTRVFSAEAAWEQQGEQTSVEAAPQSPPPEYVPPARTETGRPVAQDDSEFTYLPPAAAVAGESDRRPPSQDRAARREQRRRRLRFQRLVASAVLVAVVVLVVVLVIRGCGDSDASAAITAVLGVVVLDGRPVPFPGQQ